MHNRIQKGIEYFEKALNIVENQMIYDKIEEILKKTENKNKLGELYLKRLQFESERIDNPKIDTYIRAVS